MSNAIIVGGKLFDVLGPVKTLIGTEQEVRAGEGYNKRRRRDIDMGVWHWTGSENSLSVMAAVLRRRKLGVEFAIDPGGVIWQFCDPTIVNTADAGRVNDRSFGVEIVNYGFKWGKNRPIPRQGQGRPTYECRMNDRTRTFAHFHPAQIAAALSLANAMSTACDIPRRVPTCCEGWYVDWDTLPQEELDAFTGHLGHYHITKKKSDPGLDLLEVFRSSFSSLL